MNFKTVPYKHQREAFERFKDAEYFALFADMGTGKSKIAIDVCAHRFLKGDVNACLIIAPNNVHAQWVREQFPAHCPINYRPFIWSSGKFGNKRWREGLNEFLAREDHLLKVLAVNVEAFQSDTIVPTIATFVKTHACFIIVDEATRIKTPKAKRTKTIHLLNKYGVRCILTGTPTAKSPFDLWSQMEFLKANYFETSYFIFQHRYGIMMQGFNPYSGGRYTTLIDERTYAIVRNKIKQMLEARGGAGLMPNDYETIAALYKVSEKNVKFIEGHEGYTRFKRLDELKALIQRDVYSVRKEDCLDLPPKVYEALLVDMNPEQRRVYRNLKAELMAQYQDKELTIANKVSLTLRLMQVAGGFFPYAKEVERIRGDVRYVELQMQGMLIGESSAKLDAIKADLEEVPDDQALIIWAHFVPELRHVYAELKKEHECRLYYGGTYDEDRRKIVDDFQAGRFRILVANPATAGFGLNLQRATLQYYYSNTFKVEDRLQAEDRSHRIGVKGAVVYKDVIVKNSIDEKVYANIRSGRDMNDYFKRSTLKELLDDADDSD